MNAKSLTDAGAGLLIQQDKLTPRSLHELIEDFVSDDMRDVRSKLSQMANAARSQAKPDATQDVVKWCKKLAQSSQGKTDVGNGGR